MYEWYEGYMGNAAHGHMYNGRYYKVHMVKCGDVKRSVAV
jgi:hypothetical protein